METAPHLGEKKKKKKKQSSNQDCFHLEMCFYA